MGEFSQLSGNGGSLPFDDQAIRAFLLGRLSAAEQAQFEERLFIDEVFETRVRLIECELADDYAFARLQPEDRKLFERYYLVSDGRQQTLIVSNALRGGFGFVTDRRPNTIRERLKLRLGINETALRLAFSLAILIVLVATVWLVTKEPHLAKHFMPRRAPISPTPSTPREVHHPSNPTSTPVHREDTLPMPPHESAPATVTSFVLSPNRREAASIPVVDLPKGDDAVVRFQLSLQPNPSGTYRAELLTDDGQSIFSTESLTANGSVATIDFDVPARSMKLGNYVIKIVGGTTPVAGGASYYFLAR